MSGRDFRTILLGTASSAAVATVAYWGIGHWLPALGLMAIYDLWLLTRPGAIRLFRRVSGKTPPGDAYFREESDSYIAARAAVDNARPRTPPPIRPAPEAPPTAVENGGLTSPGLGTEPPQAKKIATSNR